MVDLVMRECKCNLREAQSWLARRGHAEVPLQPPTTASRIIASYPYRDEHGDLLYEVVRKQPKAFLQRRPDGAGGWDWSVKGLRRVLYNLDRLSAASPSELVFLVEGEKDADRLTGIGLLATTVPGGANKWRSDYAAILSNRKVVILPDNDGPGRKHAHTIKAALLPVASSVVIVDLNGLPEKGDVSDWLDAGGKKQELIALAEAALVEDAARPPESPVPLFRDRPPPEPVPTNALGPFRRTVEAIEAQTQAPVELALQSVLAVASAAVQPLVDVSTLGGRTPVSLFLFSIAESGERKSACDQLAIESLQLIERSEMRKYPERLERYARDIELHEDGKRRSAVAGPSMVGEMDEPSGADLAPPTKPLAPHRILSDFTYEGIRNHLEDGLPSVAVFSDEGGMIVGGHAMNSENRLKTAAGLSRLWDGAPVNRTRGGAPTMTLYGRRVAVHLMMQPRVAAKLFEDKNLRDQGLLARTLIAWPQSRIGYREVTDRAGTSQESQDVAGAIDIFSRRITELLRLPFPTIDGMPQELDPRLLALSQPARTLLIEYANAVEEAQRPGGTFERIRGTASKAAEQAARIAAVMTIFVDKHAEEISDATMADAIDLGQWYLNEAQRILDMGEIPEELQRAEVLRTWLVDRWHDDHVSVRAIVRRGPNEIRNTRLVRALIKVLEQNGWLRRSDDLVSVDGVPAREAWRVVRP